MPLHIPNAYVAEDYSEPMLQADGQALVEVRTYVNGRKVGVRAEILTADEVASVLSSPPGGGSIREAIGIGVLGFMSANGRTNGAEFPGDYVSSVEPPAEDPAPADAEPATPAEVPQA